MIPQRRLLREITRILVLSLLENPPPGVTYHAHTGYYDISRMLPGMPHLWDIIIIQLCTIIVVLAVIKIERGRDQSSGFLYLCVYVCVKEKDNTNSAFFPLQ